MDDDEDEDLQMELEEDEGTSNASGTCDFLMNCSQSIGLLFMFCR